MKKRIIFITNALWVGGIETALINLLNYMDYEKYDITLLTMQSIFDFDMRDRVPPRCHLLTVDRERKHSYEKKYKFNKLYHLVEPSNSPSKFHRLMMWTTPALKWIENKLYIQYVHNLLKDEHYDTAIIYSDVIAEIAIKAVSADKFLMFYHHGAMRRVYHDQIAYDKCDKIIAVSENQAVQLKKFVPSAADKIISIHNLTDVENIRAKALQPTAEVFDQTKFNIVSVGRVSHEKGMDIAVKVCAKLVTDGFDNIRWWIVGGGPAMQEVINTIAETHMEKYVITVGMQRNPYPYIRQADLYVQPSRFEGYPMTILEALMLGQPVVSTDNNGAREILQEGKTGFLCPIDVNMLADILEMLLCRNGLFNELKSHVLLLDFKKQNKQNIETLEKYL